MTEMPGACDSSGFDGTTILVESRDIGFYKFVFISGVEVIKYSTGVERIGCIVLMCNNMIRAALAFRNKHRCFSSDLYKFIENETIEIGTLLNSTNSSLDPFGHHHSKYAEGAFKTMQCNQIHCFYPNEQAGKDDEEEDLWRSQRHLINWVEEQRN